MKRARPTVTILGALLVISTGALAATTVTVWTLVVYDATLGKERVIKTYSSPIPCEGEAAWRGHDYRCVPLH
jgi:hypothetical protein